MRLHHLQPQTPISSYLSKLNERNLVPIPMGLIKKHGACENLDTSNFSMGDHYAEAMAEGFKSLKVRKVNLKNNGLSDSSTCKIVANLDPKYCTELNIAENHIGIRTIEAICKICASQISRLQTLNLESNGLCDKHITVLCSSLLACDRLRELFLSRNKISEEGAISLASYVYSTLRLEKLDLSWNCIRGLGGQKIFKGIEGNESIQVLDLSWNSLASPKEESCVQIMAETLQLNKSLVHLDISHNMLESSDCLLLQKSLNENHSILGLHVEGNHADLDTKGYLIVTQSIDSSSSLNCSRIVYKSKALKQKNKNCWICQRWNEIEFRWRNGKSGPYGEEPVMVHLHFENFAGCTMVENADSSYRTIRMCPPGKIYFFFTLKGKFFSSLEYDTAIKKIEFAGEAYNTINVVENRPSPSQLWLQLKPLARPREEMPCKEVIPDWDFERSVFKDYVSDSAELLTECFNEDLDRSKIKELTGKEYNGIIEYLRQFYPAIKETYKTLAAKAWLDWDSWLEILQEFALTSKMIGSSDLTLYDIESLIKTFRYWNSTTEVFFARYHFLELVVRISIIKYYRNRDVAKISQAVKLFFKQFFSAFDKLSSNEFRTEKLYTKAMNKIMGRHQHLLVKIYYNFAIEGTLTCAGFYKMMQGTVKDYAVVQTAFILSKETSVTFAYFNDSLKFVEFLEALVRVVDAFKKIEAIQTRLDLFVEEIIETKLEPLLQNMGNLVENKREGL
jgi:hypothetical protein